MREKLNKITLYFIGLLFSCATKSIDVPSQQILQIIDNNGLPVTNCQLFIQSSKNEYLIDLISNQQGEYIFDFNKKDFPITIKIKDSANKYNEYEKVVNSLNAFNHKIIIELESTKTMLTGVIVGEKDDEPIADCEIYTDPMTDQTFTNEDGEFELYSDNLLLGNVYNVIVTHSKYNTYTWTGITITKNKLIDLGYAALKLSDFWKPDSLEGIRHKTIIDSLTPPPLPE